MKFLALIDSFKGSISSLELSQFLKSKISSLDYFPTSDGGEGFLDTIKYLNSSLIEKEIEVYSLNNELIKVPILIDEIRKIAYIESAKIIGLSLAKSNKDIFSRTSRGIGESLLILEKRGYKEVYISLGGSGTSEMGLGILASLGLNFYDLHDKKVSVKYIKDIKEVKKLDFKDFYKLNIKINIVNDVNNYLLGEKGANKVFAKQKGASEEDINKLENLFFKFAYLIKDQNREISPIRGDGSAGGIGFVFNQILKANYLQGIDFLLKAIDYKELIKKYDYIITGEGRFDDQSLNGKVIGGILKETPKEYLDKIIVICGENLLKSKEYNEKIKVYSLFPDYAKDKKLSIKFPKKYLPKLIIDLKRDLKIIRQATHRFPPFINDNSEILILGSFPSLISLKENFYYMNKGNRFYKVISLVFNETFPETLKEKQEVLKRHKIALYDVIESCEIEGSQDSAIYDFTLSDIPRLVENYPIKKIVLTGNKASAIFKEYFKDYLNMAYFLPSTSGLNAKFSLDELVKIYKSVLI